MTDRTYLERARAWLETAEDLDLESLEATIAKFAGELKKASSTSEPNAAKQQDLRATLEYLKQELEVLSGSAEAARPSEVPPPAIKAPKIPANEYVFDPSPLFDMSDEPTASIGAAEKERLLRTLKTMPGIISVADLVRGKKGDK